MRLLRRSRGWSRRLAMAGMLGSGLLLAGCASSPAQTADEARTWERCNRSWPENLTYVCVKW